MKDHTLLSTTITLFGRANNIKLIPPQQHGVGHLRMVQSLAFNNISPS